jgi:peptidylprolyl isomerase
MRPISAPRRRRWTARSAVAGLAAVAAVTAGCSSSPTSSQGLGGSGTTSSPSSPSSRSSTAGGAGTSGSAAIEWSPAGAFGTKPTVVVPSGTAPTQLETHDLIVGSGATAKAGDTVTVQYVGYSWTTKQQFDASWDRGQPFSFPLGEHQVITGWDEGVAGMQVGGRRELVIPPNLAYGASSPGPGIVANDTLIFVVDLLKVG